MACAWQWKGSAESTVLRAGPVGLVLCKVVSDA